MIKRLARDRDPLVASAYLIAAAICLTASQQAYGQAAANPPAANAAENSTDSDVIELSPFVIEATEDSGYLAKSTLAGTQVRTELRDVGSAISVVTPKFLQDTNSRNSADLLVLTTNTEVAGQGGNFLGGGDGPTADGRATVASPAGSTRVRGLAEADNVRDFFLTDIPWDSYNTGRVDLQRGANSVLFGIGSPAGIVNNSLNTATFKDSNRVEGEFGAYGSTRLSADLNKVILKNELAVRVSALRDDKKYRQDPAYRDDHRVFGAVTYSPKVLAVNGMKTTLRANIEKGNIHSNLPRLTPPMDTITPFFWSGTVTGGDGVTYNHLNRNTYTALENDPVTTRTNALYNPSVGAAGGRVYDGMLAIFGGPDATSQSMLVPSSVANWPSTDLQGRNGPAAGYKGITNYGSYLQNIRTPGYSFNPFKNRSLTDPSVFDFYNNLIEGDNAKQWSKFRAHNFDVTQTFFNNKVGFNLTYDNQKITYGNQNYVSWDAGAIGVDLMETFVDGTPNPNVGKAYLLAGGGSAGSNQTERLRETLRAKVFAELNFADYLNRESLAARILGRHNFTLNYTDYEATTYEKGWVNWYIGSGYGPSAASSVGQASRDVIQVTYLSDVDLRTRSSAAGLNLQRLNALQMPVSGTANQWNTGVAEDPDVPAGFRQYNVPVVAPSLQDEATRDYTRQRYYRDKITSQVFVWQGYLFDGNVVPMFGWRKDISKNYDAGAPVTSGGISHLSPDYTLPDEYSNRVEGQTRTFSIVGHVPKSLMKNLPGDLRLSAFYNQSENFKPDASRLDLIGNRIAAPTGETKDYGIVISAFDDKLSLKVNRYKTRVDLATLDGGGIGNIYLIGAGEAWGQQAALRVFEDQGQGQGSGNFGVASNGRILRYQPQDIPENWAYDGAGNALDSNGGLFEDGDTHAYNQAAIDRTWTEQDNAVRDWLSKPIPKSMQDAWRMTDYATGGGSWSQNTVAVTGDTLSEGTEFELAATPIKGLDIAFNAAKTDAMRLNIGKAYSDYIDQRLADYAGPMGDVRIWGGGNWFYDNRPANPLTPGVNGSDGTVRNKFYNEVVPNYLFMRATTNTSVAELRPWRFNVVANYAFQDGILKGANIGGSYRWQDKQVTGYRLNSTGTNYDVNNKWYGPSEDTIDIWLGYGRKLTDKVNWRIQVNVRNLFYTKDLIPVTVQPDGSPGTYRLPEPRVWTVTNVFEF